MDMGVFHSVLTVVAFAVFIGIVCWAWSGRSRERFAEASQLPLEDERSDEAQGAGR